MVGLLLLGEVDLQQRQSQQGRRQQGQEADGADADADEADLEPLDGSDPELSRAHPLDQADRQDGHEDHAEAAEGADVALLDGQTSEQAEAVDGTTVEPGQHEAERDDGRYSNHEDCVGGGDVCDDGHVDSLKSMWRSLTHLTSYVHYSIIIIKVNAYLPC